MAQAAVPQKPSSAALQPVWSVEVEFDGPPRIAVGRHAVFVVSPETGLAAYSIDGGRKLWQSSLRSTADPAVAGELVALAIPGGIEVLSETTGQTAWKAAVDGDGAVSLYGTDRLLLAVQGAEIRAWRHDGTTAWTYTSESLPTTPLLSTPAGLLLGVAKPEILSLDPGSGSVKWRSPIPARATSLSLAGDQLIMSGSDDALYSFRVEASLKKNWKSRTYRRLQPIGQALFDERWVYLAIIDNTLRAFDRSSGSQRWTQSLDSRPMAGPTLLAGTLVIPLVNGELAQVTAATGSKAAAQPPGARSAERLNAAAASQAGVFAVVTASDNRHTLKAWGTKR
jgi:outer membrane protein assembly factor BamB